MSMNVAIPSLTGHLSENDYLIRQFPRDPRFRGDFRGEYRSRTDDLLRARQAL